MYLVSQFYFFSLSKFKGLKFVFIAFRSAVRTFFSPTHFNSNSHFSNFWECFLKISSHAYYYLANKYILSLLTWMSSSFAFIFV